MGSNAGRARQFVDKVGQVANLHASLSSLLDAPVEMVLGRLCADVSRVNHWLRGGVRDRVILLNRAFGGGKMSPKAATKSLGGTALFHLIVM